MDESGFGMDQETKDALTKVDIMVMIGIVVFLMAFWLWAYFDEVKAYVQI